MTVMGMVFGTVAGALYIVDAYCEWTFLGQFYDKRGTDANEAEIAVEAFTCMLIFKNMFSFALTWSAYNWILEDGVVKIFLIIGSVQVVVCLSGVPMCKFHHRPKIAACGKLTMSCATDIFGKRNRLFMRKHDILKMTRLD